MQPTTISTTNPTTMNYIKCVCASNNVECDEVKGGLHMPNPTTDVYRRIDAYVRTGNYYAKKLAERIERGER